MKSGIEWHKIEGVKVPVYSVAKTVADCFRFRHKIGVNIAVEALRDAWPDLALQINLGGGSFKTQFKRADKSGAEFAILLGDDEAARGVVAIKALRREAAQEECPIDQIGERLGVLLGLKGG